MNQVSREKLLKSIFECHTAALCVVVCFLNFFTSNLTALSRYNVLRSTCHVAKISVWILFWRKNGTDEFFNLFYTSYNQSKELTYLGIYIYTQDNMKVLSSALAISLLIGNSLSFTLPLSRTNVPSALSASVTKKNMSEWERWKNEPTHVNLRPEYRQDDIYFNQRRPLNEYHENQQRFATTKSRVVDDDPWRKVKVDEYTPTGINHNRQYKNQNYESMYGDYDPQQVRTRQGFQNDIRQNYQTVNNGYQNKNAEYLQGHQGLNQGYRQGYQSNQGVYQGYRTHPSYSNDSHRQTNRIDGYRDDIRQHYQPVQNFSHRDKYRSNAEPYDKKTNRFDVWEAERVRGRISDIRSNDRYADASVRRNGVSSYSQPHHNLLSSDGYYNDHDYNLMNNRQTKRFPSYEDQNFDPTSNIDPIPGSNSKRQNMQPAYDPVDINYYNRNQFKNTYGRDQYSNTRENYNFNGRNDRVNSRMVNNNDYQRGNVGFSSNGRQDYRTNNQNVPYQQNPRVRSMNDYYEFNRHTTKRFPSYEQDDDPTCPKESR